MGRRTHETQETERNDVTAQTFYDDAGRVIETRDAAGNATRYVYDGSGQVEEVRTPNPAGGTLSTRNAYTSRGELWRTWGDVPYPVQYAYDDWDRMTSMQTFQGGSGWNGTSWRGSPGQAPDTTTWAYDEASGLLTSKTEALGRAVTCDYWHPEPRYYLCVDVTPVPE